MVLALIGCGRLSDSKARDLIEHSDEFRAPRVAPLFTGNATFELLDPIYPALTDLGLIEISSIDESSLPMVKAIVTLRFQDQAEKEWKHEAVEGGVAWTVPLGVRECTSIIGVRSINTEATEVEFEWKWHLTRYGTAVAAQRSEIGRRYQEIIDRLNSSISKGTILERYKRASFNNLLMSMLDGQRKIHGNEYLNPSMPHQCEARFTKFNSGWQLRQSDKRQLIEDLSNPDN
jgi:hypothetical protein